MKTAKTVDNHRRYQNKLSKYTKYIVVILLFSSFSFFLFYFAFSQCYTIIQQQLWLLSFHIFVFHRSQIAHHNLSIEHCISDKRAKYASNEPIHFRFKFLSNHFPNKSISSGVSLSLIDPWSHHYLFLFQFPEYSFFLCDPSVWCLIGSKIQAYKGF